MPDVVIVGGGHNALVAAAYLGQAGHSVLLLERSDHLGGAAVSAQAFDGVPARLSRYSYLVSLLPRQIIADLGLRIDLIRRGTSSYTPDPADPRRGLLIGERATTFERIGASRDAAAWAQFYDDVDRLAHRLFPTMLSPLPTRAEARAIAGDDRLWTELTEVPIGHSIRERFQDDLVRGVVATDALIGTFASLEDDLEANRCFLYHLLGGPWDVPRGGMGALTAAMTTAAAQAGAQLLTEADVTSIDPDGLVRYARNGSEHEVRAAVVLSGVAPAVLRGLLDETGDGAAPEGSQVKVNLVVRRLPRLADASVDPAQAFGGTFHVNETYTHLQDSWHRAAGGTVPSPLPCEVYCHSLADPSILGPELQAAGAQTLTVFGLHTPHRLTAKATPTELRRGLGEAVLTSLNSVLAEPIKDLLLTDAHGEPCLEVRTTADLQADLGMPGGHIFHGALSWPFALDGADLQSPAARWGVTTHHERVLLCGSGAMRAGAVSGIGGHNAAMAALELLTGRQSVRTR